MRQYEADYIGTVQRVMLTISCRQVKFTASGSRAEWCGPDGQVKGLLANGKMCMIYCTKEKAAINVTKGVKVDREIITWKKLGIARNHR